MSEAMKLAKDIQAFASMQLYVESPPPFTDIEEWNQMQQHLSIALKQLEKVHGDSQEEEGEIVLAMLMGYCIAVRNGKKVTQTLQRAKHVIHQLKDEMLKCKLAVHCYLEVPDRELLGMASYLMQKLKQQGKWNEIKPLQYLIEQQV